MQIPRRFLICGSLGIRSYSLSEYFAGGVQFLGLNLLDVMAGFEIGGQLSAGRVRSFSCARVSLYRPSA